jgi:hypothetical protein
MIPLDLSTARPPSTRTVRPSSVLCTRSPTPTMILTAARNTAPATCTPRDKQTRFSKRSKDKRKTKRNYPGFEFDPCEVNDSSQSNQGIDHLVSHFPSFVMLSLACVFVRDGLSSIEMWVDCGEDQCCGLSKVGMVETVGFYQVMWFVMLESAKDQILGVDTPGQHVPPHVQCGTTCLLIWYAIGCVSCSVEWGWHHTLWTAWTTETLALQAGTICSGNRSKAWHTPVVDLCNSM